MGLRAKIIWFMIAIVFSPLFVAGSVFISLVSNVISNPNDQVNEIEESFYELEQQIYENYGRIDDDQVFFEKIEPFLVENHLRLEIESLEGELLFDSERFLEAEEYEGLRGFLEKFNTYTISIIQDNKKVANAYVHATPLSPDVFTVNSDFFFSVTVAILFGFVTFILLVVLFSIYISRNILTPLERLDVAMQYVSEGDYSFDFHVKAKNEMGRLALSFKEMRETLKDSLEKQEAYERARKELIASISHDLRTPLASIQGYVEGLKDGITEDEEQREKYLSIIQDKSKQLDRLIEDLFEFSKVELDQLQMQLVPMESMWLDEIFNQAAIDGQQLQLEVEVNHDIPNIPLLVDPDRITQVLSNLVQNAKRYNDSDRGKVWISTKVEGPWFIIKVRDNGIGISEKNIPFIFDRFYRAERSRSRSFGGTGLGLSICKAIMEAHNGKIEVKSKEGAGTEFTLYLPIKK